MSNLEESRYYENPALWDPERYQQEYELRRFATCADMIPKDTRSLLDVGTGTGAFLAHLESRAQAVTLRGMERSEAAISTSVCSCEIDRGTVDKMQYADRAFDLVSALEVIEHLPFGVYEKALREIERVAARHILVSVPYRERTPQIRCPYCKCRCHPNNHMRRFDSKIVGRIFESFRLVASKKVYVTNLVLGNLLSLVYRNVFDRRELFPENSHCPQCGFERITESVLPVGSDARRPWGVKEVVRGILPKRRRPWWIIGLYQRKA